jgi:hypothetical protein
LVGRPEAGRVRRQHLVDEDEAPGVVEAELELGVGDDDAAGQGIGGGVAVDAEGHVPDLPGEVLADEVGGVAEAHVLVVLADGGLGGRGIDGLRQPVRLAQPGRQRDVADGAGALVVLPAGADEVAAHDGLHRQRPHLAHDDGALAEGAALVRVRHDIGEREVGQVVRHQVRRARKPEVGHPGEHLALARDRLRQHHVEGGEPVGGDDEHVRIVDAVDVAHLAAVDERQVLQVRLKEGHTLGGHGDKPCPVQKVGWEAASAAATGGAC